MSIEESKPLTSFSDDARATVSNELCYLASDSMALGPEAFKLLENPFQYIDSLANECLEQTNCQILYGTGVIVGALVIRHVQKREANLIKPPRSRSELQVVGSGLVAELIAYSPNYDGQVRVAEIVSSLGYNQPVEQIVIEPTSPRRNFVSTLIGGRRGVQHITANHIGGPQTYVSHDKTPLRPSVYPGYFKHLVA